MAHTGDNAYFEEDVELEIGEAETECKIWGESQRCKKKELLTRKFNEPAQFFNEKYPVLGLEYVVAMVDDIGSVNFCILCARYLKVIIYKHVTSIEHERNYILKHFPTLHGRVLSRLKIPNEKTKERLVHHIFRGLYYKCEKKKGLRRISSADYEAFQDRPADFIQPIIEKNHYDENTLDQETTEALLLTLIEICHKYKNTLGFYPACLPLPETDSLSYQYQKEMFWNQFYQLNEKKGLAKWNKYLDIKKEKLNKLREKYKNYENQPELHPDYSYEWKKYYTEKYEMLKEEGIPISKYDFEKDWCPYWIQYIEKCYSSELEKLRENLRCEFGLPLRMSTLNTSRDVSVNFPENEEPIIINDSDSEYEEPSELNLCKEQNVASQEKTDEFTQMHNQHEKSFASDQRLPSAIEISDQLLPVLRVLSALEHHLGSLGPKCMELLEETLSKEKTMQVQEMLTNRENLIFFETVNLKLKSLLKAQSFAGNVIETVRDLVDDIDDLLDVMEGRINWSFKDNTENQSAENTKNWGTKDNNKDQYLNSDNRNLARKTDDTLRKQPQSFNSKLQRYNEHQNNDGRNTKQSLVEAPHSGSVRSISSQGSNVKQNSSVENIKIRTAEDNAIDRRFSFGNQNFASETNSSLKKQSQSSNSKLRSPDEYENDCVRNNRQSLVVASHSSSLNSTANFNTLRNNPVDRKSDSNTPKANYPIKRKSRFEDSEGSNNFTNENSQKALTTYEYMSEDSKVINYKTPKKYKWYRSDALKAAAAATAEQRESNKERTNTESSKVSVDATWNIEYNNKYVILGKINSGLNTKSNKTEEVDGESVARENVTTSAPYTSMSSADLRSKPNERQGSDCNQVLKSDDSIPNVDMDLHKYVLLKKMYGGLERKPKEFKDETNCIPDSSPKKFEDRLVSARTISADLKYKSNEQQLEKYRSRESEADHYRSSSPNMPQNNYVVLNRIYGGVSKSNERVDGTYRSRTSRRDYGQNSNLELQMSVREQNKISSDAKRKSTELRERNYSSKIFTPTSAPPQNQNIILNKIFGSLQGKIYAPREDYCIPNEPIDPSHQSPVADGDYDRNQSPNLTERSNANKPQEEVYHRRYLEGDHKRRQNTDTQSEYFIFNKLYRGFKVKLTEPNDPIPSPEPSQSSNLILSKIPTGLKSKPYESRTENYRNQVPERVFDRIQSPNVAHNSYAILNKIYGGFKTKTMEPMERNSSRVSERDYGPTPQTHFEFHSDQHDEYGTMHSHEPSPSFNHPHKTHYSSSIDKRIPIDVESNASKSSESQRNSGINARSCTDDYWIVHDERSSIDSKIDAPGYHYQNDYQREGECSPEYDKSTPNEHWSPRQKNLARRIY